MGPALGGEPHGRERVWAAPLGVIAGGMAALDHQLDGLVDLIRAQPGALGERLTDPLWAFARLLGQDLLDASRVFLAYVRLVSHGLPSSQVILQYPMD